MGDNVGGGGPANSTPLISALHASGIGPSVATLFDPAAVAGAEALGPGHHGEFSIGDSNVPLKIRASVRGIYDGRFSESQPRHGGATHFDMGKTAVLQTPSLTIVVTSRRLFPVSLNQYSACGLDVDSFKVFVAKGVHAPIAAYDTLGVTFVHVNTPGVTGADLSRFDFRHRRRPMFPFE